MKKGKLFKYISNISFGLGAALAAVVLYIIISARASGTCPINSNLPFIIPALIFLVIAFVTSFFAEKKDKNTSAGKQSGKQ